MNGNQDQKNGNSGLSSEATTALLYTAGSIGFAVLACLVCGVGFLIQYTFFNTLGVADPLADPLQVTFAYVGLLFFALPLGIGMTLFSYYKSLKPYFYDPFEAAKSHRVTLSFILQLVFFLFAFDLLIGFSRPGMGDFSEHRGAYFWLVGLTIILAMVRSLEDSVRESTNVQPAPTTLTKTTAPAGEPEDKSSDPGSPTNNFASSESQTQSTEVKTQSGPISFKERTERIYLWFRKHSLIVNVARIASWLHEFLLGYRGLIMCICSLARIVVVTATMVIILYLFRGLWPLLWHMLKTGGYLYLATLFLIFVLFVRTESRLSEKTTSTKGKDAKADSGTPGKEKRETPSSAIPPTTMFLVVCLELPLIYLSILTFAFRIYPYIPANRGGGDYSVERMAIIRFDPQFTNAIPPLLMASTPNDVHSKPVYILHQTPDAVFIALPCLYNVPRNIISSGTAGSLAITNESHESCEASVSTNILTCGMKAYRTITNGPNEWREPGVLNKPKAVFSVKKEAVISVSYGERRTIYQDCTTTELSQGFEP